MFSSYSISRRVVKPIACLLETGVLSIETCRLSVKTYSPSVEVPVLSAGTGTPDTGLFLPFGKFFPESLEVVFQALHEFPVEQNGVVVHQVKFGHGFFVFVDEHERVRLQYLQVFQRILQVRYALLQDGGHRLIEMLVRIADPFLHDAPRQFRIVIIEYKQFAAFLLDLQVQVGEWQVFYLDLKFLRDLSQGAFHLLDCVC